MTSTPVARMTSMRVILAIVAHEGVHVEQLDVDSTYLNGIIDVEVFMQ
jgi:Reverse transcriptase (RNA-dependent DNA polymerase)